MNNREEFQKIVEEATTSIIQGMIYHGNIDAADVNFAETPKRVAKAYLEIFDGIFDSTLKIKEILSKTFPAKSKEMITVGPITVWSVCPHHLLPVKMEVWVGYMPKEKVLGLSKLARLSEIIAKKPALQEDTTVEIAEALQLGLRPSGAGCVIKGRHLCMEMRGVKKEAVTTSTSLVGDFLRPEVRAEFLASIRR